MKVVMTIEGPFDREDAEAIAEGVRNGWREFAESDPDAAALVSEHVTTHVEIVP